MSELSNLVMKPLGGARLMASLALHDPPVEVATEMIHARLDGRKSLAYAALSRLITLY